MEDDEAAFHVWLCGALSRVKLEDEAYVGYVESILKEDTYQPDEKKDAVLEFLASSSVRGFPPPPLRCTCPPPHLRTHARGDEACTARWWLFQHCPPPPYVCGLLQEEDLTAFGDELMAHWNKIEEAKHAVLQAKKTQEDEQLKAAQALQQKEREEKAKQRAYVCPHHTFIHTHLRLLPPTTTCS
jgi:hypothetical protein